MIKNYLITGDCHGRFDRFFNQDQERHKPEETAFIILGDAGLNFYLNKTDANNKKKLQNTGYTFYCVRGNHEERPENLPMITYTYDCELKEYVIIEEPYPNIRYLMDGYVYNFNGHSALVIGGAYSVDKWYRLERFPNYKTDPTTWTGWFADEQLTTDELAEIKTEHAGKSFDFILSHTCPISWQPVDLFLRGLDQSTVDNSMEIWMEEFKDCIDWKIWLFGHFHDDRLVRPGVEMYYYDIEDMEAIWQRWTSGEELEWYLKKDPKYDEGV